MRMVPVQRRTFRRSDDTLLAEYRALTARAESLIREMAELRRQAEAQTRALLAAKDDDDPALD